MNLVRSQFVKCMPDKSAIEKGCQFESSSLEMHLFGTAFEKGPMACKRNSFDLEPGGGLFINASCFCLPKLQLAILTCSIIGYRWSSVKARTLQAERS